VDDSLRPVVSEFFEITKNDVLKTTLVSKSRDVGDPDERTSINLSQFFKDPEALKKMKAEA
jgi:hypothetical protein